MNYNHHYHAGNFADIIKHLTLIFCLEKLHQKDTPFFALDTHSGSAKYDLQDEPAIKTGEALDGIYHFIKNCDLKNPLIENYIKILEKINETDKISARNLKFYMGSPYIIKHFLRPQDRAIFAEIKNEEFLKLKENLAGKQNISFLNENGFELTKSKLPPLEKRGLILIDPAFEKNSDLISKDYEKTIKSLEEAQKRFLHGIYLVWHPIINKENDQKILEAFYDSIKNLKFKEIVHIIFQNGNNLENKMNSCGLFVINPCFGLEEKLREVFEKNLIINKIK